MSETIINLPARGNVVEAWIKLTTKTLATAKSVDLDDLTNVECVEIEGFMKTVRALSSKGVPLHNTWRGHDIAKMLAVYSDIPEVAEIAPLWARWGTHAQKNLTRVQKETLDAAKRDGELTEGFVENVLKTADRGHVYGTEKLVEPLDPGVIDEINTAFGVK